MIKAQDLRIGNLVELKDGEIITADGVEDFYIYSELKDNVALEDINPIPIDEDWLLKFGFVQSENPNHTPTWLWRREHKTWLIEQWVDGTLTAPMEHATAEIKYVHQLQNLYYALTGEELAV